MTADEGELPLARRSGKSEAAFRTISEVADDLDVPQHVLRFWESKFPQVRPLKRGGGRRYYRPEDVTLLKRIRDLLYSEGYTIKGVQKLLREGVHKDGVAAGKSEELRLDLGRDDQDLPPEDEPEDASEADIEVAEDVADEPETIDAATAVPAPPAALAPETRRELLGILNELEQLRALLQPR